MRAAVKAVNPRLEVGFHIEHVNSFNPIFRATRSYADLAAKADFLKVVVYNNCGGERYRRFIENLGSTVFRDVPKDELLRFNNHLLGYGDEAGLEALPTTGLSPDYVARETKRALAGVDGRCRVLPGIDIGIPTGPAQPQGKPRRHLRRGRGRDEGGCRRGGAVAQVFRDASGQPRGRRPRDPRTHRLTPERPYYG